MSLVCLHLSLGKTLHTDNYNHRNVLHVLNETRNTVAHTPIIQSQLFYCILEDRVAIKAETKVQLVKDKINSVHPFVLQSDYILIFELFYSLTCDMRFIQSTSRYSEKETLHMIKPHS